MTSPYGSGNGRTHPQVRVVDRRVRQIPYHGVDRRSPVKAGTSMTRWIVRSMMIATTAFALLDLFLLISGGHH